MPENGGEMLARGRNFEDNIYAIQYTLKPKEGLLEMEELLQQESMKKEWKS